MVDSKLKTQWAYTDSYGEITIVNLQRANEAYMTAQEYAIVRAKILKGNALKRTTKVVTSKWENITNE